MHTSAGWWNWVVTHRADVWVAATFAVIFGILIAVIFELLDFGSKLRSGLRHIKNKLSEQSASRLRKRSANSKSRELSLLDSRAKVEKVIEKLDLEIAGLRSKLDGLGGARERG